MDAHTASAIAQIVFYAPATVYAHYLGIRCWKYGPRMAWYMIMVFSLLRLTGGGLMIAYQQDRKNIGLIIATYVLLNVGLVPLLTVFNNLLRLVSYDASPRSKIYTQLHKICGLLIIGAAGLLAAAGGRVRVGQSSSEATTLKTLFIVAYFEFIFVFVVLTMLSVYLYVTARHQLRKDHAQYLRWLLIATPGVALRAAYGVIAVFEATGENMTTSMWSPLFGSALAFSLMALLPEFIVLCIFMHVARQRLRAASAPGWEEDRPPKPKGSLMDRLRFWRRNKAQKSVGEASV